MNQRFTNTGHRRATDNAPNNQQPMSFPASAPPMSSISPAALPAQTLPLSEQPPHHASSYGDDDNPFASTRNLPVHPSMMNGPVIQTTEAEMVPVYAPTAHAHYNPQAFNVSRPPSYPQLSQAPNMRPFTSASQQSGYTSAVRLPNLQPQPMPNGNGAVGHTRIIIPNGVQYRSASGSHESTTDDEPQPTRVVGSQGRRGPIPASAGKPPPPLDLRKHEPLIVRDKDGKYQCPHCTKKYLHGKHLKRHLLRHTGVRPYTCGLCKDTFSRSDILKRHFQKCSQRRGNPTGESHLTHSRATRKIQKASEGQAIAAGINAMSAEQVQQMSSFPSTALNSPMGIGQLDLGNLNYTERQQQQLATHMARTSSFRNLENVRNGSNRGSMGSLNTSSYDPPPTSSAFSTGHVTPDSITTSGAATPYTYPYEARSNQISPADGTFPTSISNGIRGVSQASGVSHYGLLPQIVGHPNARAHEVDWSSAFTPFNSQDDYASGHYHSGPSTPQHPVKSEHDYTDWTFMQQQMKK